ncbi:MAG: LysR family transcriptional regulator [Rhodospirillales bacterium]|nr:LysR family transcriptional regulator [Rhodospirillales bacterium]
MRNLPPLAALRAFEATARLGGAKAASEELLVTQPAISHHLAKIEDFLGAKLFHRRNKRLFLTDAGRDYLNRITPAFDRIEEATRDTTRFSKADALSVATPPSFLGHWLMPKLKDFLSHQPNIDLRFVNRLTVDDESDAVDCAIEYRLQPSKDRVSTRLFDDHIVPLAAPDLVAEKNLKTVDDLAGITLIETERRVVSWLTVLRDRPWLSAQRFLTVPYSHHAFDAASRGMGVALGNYHNAQTHIESGRLTNPFVLPRAMVPPEPRYFFSASKIRSDEPKVQAFRSWILEQAAKSNSFMERTLGQAEEQA